MAASIPSRSSTMSAFVIGGTGMVGKKLVAELAQSPCFHRIVTIGRRPVSYDGPGAEKLSQTTLSDFSELDSVRSAFAGHQVGFNTMGTTRADAGSDEEFVKIDHDYPLHAARLFKEMSGGDGKEPLHFVLLTSAGSSPSSSMLYPRTKGLLEKHVEDLGFSRLSIFHPGFLRYDGEQRPKRRLAEDVASVALCPFNYLSGNRLSVGIADVAKAMVSVAEEKTGPAIGIYDNKQIDKLGKQRKTTGML